MDNFSVKELKEFLDKSQTVGIAVGRDAGVDEMGGALSLYLALKATGKDVSIASASEPTVEVSSLVGIDKVGVALDSKNGPLVVSFPYKEGEIEKISYTMEDGLLNIVVKPGDNGLSFSEKDVMFKRATGEYSELLIVVGTPKLSDLGKLFNPEGLKDTTVVNIDNKQDNQGFGDIVMVSANASSVSEQVADILLSLGLDIDQDIAQNLLYGIVFATDNFQNPRTSPLAFETAAILMQKGAQRKNIARQTLPQRDDFSVLHDLSKNVLKGRDSRDNQNQQRRPQPQQMGKPQKQQKGQPDDWTAPKVYKGSGDNQG